MVMGAGNFFTAGGLKWDRGEKGGCWKEEDGCELGCQSIRDELSPGESGDRRLLVEGSGVGHAIAACHAVSRGRRYSGSDEMS